MTKKSEKSGASKKEIRAKRRADREAKRKGKSRKLSEKILIKSKIVQSNTVPDLRNPFANQNLENYKDTYFSWKKDYADKDGEWSWRESRNWSGEEEKSINSLLKDYSQNSWQEVECQTYSGSGKYRKNLNKYQPVESLCDEAIERWLSRDILEQFETVFRLRMGSTKRLWGLRVRSYFFVIWYERHHNICPIQD